MQLIGPLDQKPFYGVAVAALAGLMLGGALKPTLADRGGPEGPQQLQPASGERVAFIDSRSSFASYPDGLPDYVIGTDWLQPAEAPVLEAPPELEEPVYEVAAWEPPPPHETYEEPEPEPSEPAYPSMGGDILHGLSRPPPPGPPALEDADLQPAEPALG